MANVRKGLLVILFLFLCGLTVRTVKIAVNIEQQNSSSVELSDKSEKAFYFYRADCPDCQKVKNTILFHQFIYDDIIFVNLENKGNRDYIEEYHLNAVPTIVRNDDQIVGSDKSEIKEFLREK